MTEDVEKLRDLTSQLDEKKKRKEEIKKLALEHRDTTTDADLDKAIDEATQLSNDITSLEKEISEIQARADKQPIKNEREEIKMVIEDKKSTVEYRQAFMEYVQKGKSSEILEKRADAYTTTTTAATVIPTTVLNEIIKEAKVAGNVLSKVRKLNIKGGLKVPTISVLPSASWIDEDTPADRKSISTGSVTFSYYGLEVRIAQSLLSEYTSIDAFEKEFVTLAVEAMTNAKEIAIFNGTGSGQPTGILQTSGINSASLTAANFAKYDKVVEALGKLPLAYRAGAELFMNAGTWDSLVGMVDTAGQPVARVNYGFNDVARSFLGYPVNLVETDRLKDFASATAGTDYFIVLGNMKYYAINSNGDLGVIKYRDEDKNQDVTKALEFLDGKVLQPKAFLAVKKVTA